MEINLFAYFFSANFTKVIIVVCYALALVFYTSHIFLNDLLNISSNGRKGLMLLGHSLFCLGTLFLVARFLATTNPIESWMQWGSLVLIVLLGIGAIVPLCLLGKKKD
jgi:hypothetical protein